MCPTFLLASSGEGRAFFFAPAIVRRFIQPLSNRDDFMTGFSSHCRSALAAILCCAAFAPQATATSLALTYTDDAGHAMPYRLFLPAGYNAPGAQFPLVLFLHGSGESGTDNNAQVAKNMTGLISATQAGPFSAFLLAPQLPTASGWGSFNPQDLSIQILNAVIAGFPVETDRLYLTGLSMGGFGTFEYMSEFPNKFAAAVPMSGGGDSSPENAARIEHIPTWIFHGRLDTTVPVQYSLNMYNVMLAAGGSPKLTILPFGFHAIWDPIYKDASINQYGLYPWMFSQSLSVPEPASIVLFLLGAALTIPRARHRRRASRAMSRPQSTT
jgi:predicted esterase